MHQFLNYTFKHPTLHSILLTSGSASLSWPCHLFCIHQLLFLHSQDKVHAHYYCPSLGNTLNSSVSFSSFSFACCINKATPCACMCLHAHSRVFLSKNPTIGKTDRTIQFCGDQSYSELIISSLTAEKSSFFYSPQGIFVIQFPSCAHPIMCTSQLMILPCIIFFKNSKLCVPLLGFLISFFLILCSLWDPPSK